MYEGAMANKITTTAAKEIHYLTLSSLLVQFLASVN